MDVRGPLSGMSILVVDDDYDARTILRGVLRHVGARVTVATGVRTARALIHTMRPDVVIVDMFLGTDTALTLITDPQDVPRRIPFIAVSAKTFLPEQLAFIGFAAYLCKPLDHTHLVATILAVLSDPLLVRHAHRGDAVVPGLSGGQRMQLKQMLLEDWHPLPVL